MDSRFFFHPCGNRPADWLRMLLHRHCQDPGGCYQVTQTAAPTQLLPPAMLHLHLPVYLLLHLLVSYNHCEQRLNHQ